MIFARFVSFFSCKTHFLCIFALAKTGEIVSARESAFFALFLRCETGHFTKLRLRNEVFGNVPSWILSKRSGSHFLILVLLGVQPTHLEIRELMKGSASLLVFNMMLFGPWGKIKNLNV